MKKKTYDINVQYDTRTDIFFCSNREKILRKLIIGVGCAYVEFTVVKTEVKTLWLVVAFSVG